VQLSAEPARWPPPSVPAGSRVRWECSEALGWHPRTKARLEKGAQPPWVLRCPPGGAKMLKPQSWEGSPSREGDRVGDARYWGR
jgi:hypothetical protein